MDIYAQNILDHYKHPHNQREMLDADLRASERNTSCGDEVEVYLKLENDKISSLSFMGHGCAISTATISILSEHLIGRSRAEILDMDLENIRSILGIEISERRSKCALIGIEAIKKALVRK